MVQAVAVFRGDRDGTRSILVALRQADGTQAPPRTVTVDLDGRLAAFVAAVQAIAGQQLDRA